MSASDSEPMSSELRTPYTFGLVVDRTVEASRQTVVEALKAEGFGVLTEIDVAATMKSKLGVDRSPYLILGACNPPLAHRAIEAEPSVGTLLPCNVVLREEWGRTVIEIMDPTAMMAAIASPAVEAVAQEARERLGRVVESVKAALPA